jgi:hypothetical protein
LSCGKKERWRREVGKMIEEEEADKWRKREKRLLMSIVRKRRRRGTEGDIMWRKGDGTSGERGKGEEEEKERRQ